MNEDLERLDALLARRHSTRAFLHRPVPRESVERVLATASRTASWCNSQPWMVHIVTGESLERLRADLVARARAGAQPRPELDWPIEYAGVYRERRRDCGRRLYRAVGVETGDREGSSHQALENFRLFGAPHLVILTSAQLLGTHGVMDCGAWVSNFLLAANAAGMGAVAQAALASYPDILRRHLDIPVDRRIVCGISFGYEDVEHAANSFRTARAPLSETVTWVG
ncbi:MAG: nitroreductase [Pseudomonadota bacterium]